MMNDTSLVPGFLFFHFWIFQALEKSGRGNEFLDNIEFWEDLPKHGFTTMPEFNVESRSDCHPWSTHVNYFFLRTVAGIQPDGFGFSKVIIKPHPGDQKYIEAKVPHHKGIISVKYNLDKAKKYAEIVLPKGLSGTFEWKGKIIDLQPGRQEFVLE